MTEHTSQQDISVPTTVIKWHFVLKQILFLSSTTHTHQIRIQKQSSVLWFMNCSEIIRTCPFKQLLKTGIIVLTEFCMMRVATFLSKWFFFIVFVLCNRVITLTRTRFTVDEAKFLLFWCVRDKTKNINSFVNNMPWLPPFWFTDNRSICLLQV